MVKYFSIFLAALLVFIRKSDSFINPQFWAEDVTVFYKEALLFGIDSLFIPYAGYYHLYPRLVALCSLVFPVKYAPMLFNLAAFGAFLLSAFYVYSKRINLAAKPLLVLLLVIAPVGTEVFVNVTNAQWHLAIVLVLIALADDAKSKITIGSEVFLTTIIAFTGPFSAIFLPIFIVRSILRRSVYSYLLAAILFIAALIQAYAIEKALGPEIQEATLSSYITGLSNIIGYFILGSFGKPPVGSFYEILWLCLAALATLMVLYKICKNPSWTGFVLFSAILLLLAAVVIKFQFQLEHFKGLGNYVLSRYTYIPGVLWTWLWIYYTQNIKLVRWLVLFPVLFLFIFAGENFRAGAYPDLKWKKESRCLKKKQHCRIPVNPPPWVLDIDLSTSTK